MAKKDTFKYISEMLAELARMADTDEAPMLTYLLQMAQTEAADECRRRSRSAPQNAGNGELAPLAR